MNFDKGYDYLGRRRGRPLKKETRECKKRLLDLHRLEKEDKISIPSQLTLVDNGQGFNNESNATPGEQPDDVIADQPPLEDDGPVLMDEDAIPEVPFAGDDEDAPDLFVAKPNGGRKGERYDPGI